MQRCRDAEIHTHVVEIIIERSRQREIDTHTHTYERRVEGEEVSRECTRET